MYQKKGKIYPLLRVEREEVQEFVKDQLRKGYIRLPKSPQTLPVFFVPKKDGKKRMMQDYWYLNSWTNQEQLSITTDFGSDRQYWEEKDIYEDGFMLGI